MIFFNQIMKMLYRKNILSFDWVYPWRGPKSYGLFDFLVFQFGFPFLGNVLLDGLLITLWQFMVRLCHLLSYIIVIVCDIPDNLQE